MIKRRYFMNGIVYNNLGTINKFQQRFISERTLFDQSYELYINFMDDLEELAKDNNCENWQVKSFSRVG